MLHMVGIEVDTELMSRMVRTVHLPDFLTNTSLASDTRNIIKDEMKIAEEGEKYIDSLGRRMLYTCLLRCSPDHKGAARIELHIKV